MEGGCWPGPRTVTGPDRRCMKTHPGRCRNVDTHPLQPGAETGAAWTDVVTVPPPWRRSRDAGDRRSPVRLMTPVPPSANNAVHSTGEAHVPAERQVTNAPTLTRWGVSAHADLVYRMLTTFGAMSDAALARTLELPVKTVRAGLEELHGLGVAGPLPGAPRPYERAWRATSPATVVSILRARQALLAGARYHLPRQLSTMDIVDLPEAALRTARPVYGVPAVRARLAELVAAERREHLAMSPEPAFSAASARAGIPAGRAALRRGVTAWTLGVPASAEDQSEQQTRSCTATGCATASFRGSRPS